MGGGGRERFREMIKVRGRDIFTFYFFAGGGGVGDFVEGKHRFDEGIRFMGEDTICGRK